MEEHKLWVIVPAAGVGSRMGGECPKQYLKLLDRSVLEHTLDRLLSAPGISQIYLPLHPQDKWWPEIAGKYIGKTIPVAGGAERSTSVLNALEKMEPHASAEDWVLVHDVARPCFRINDISNLMQSLWNTQPGGLLGVPVADTVKRTSATGEVLDTVPRTNLWRAYTPQMFRFGILLAALRQGLEKGVNITDEASAIEALGLRPVMVEGHSDNIKITHPQDLPLAEIFLRRIMQEEE
ncbi:2-C-methyl-D-erythritol 4-phosphate cytidylyltransferase [Hahella sp. NBU794]|uniref:2-C-methyl-D-erythritol 4-phosphate cytidylyltransferase n=1 Tax=Hahella sp. NBU794 TaxID=3422590 RepID=UPI003D6F133D